MISISFGMVIPKIIATIEARVGSTRLPGKVLLEAAGKPMLQHMIERVRRSIYVDEVIIAMPIGSENDPIADLAGQLETVCYRGSEENVLLRVVEAARSRQADVMVQLTGDCPLMDPSLIDECIEEYLEGDWDYVANELVRTYPIGFDVAVLKADLLASTLDEPDLTDGDREHVTTYIVDRPQRYRLCNVSAPPALDRPELQVTLDTAEDYQALKQVFEILFPLRPEFTVEDVVRLLSERTDLADINRFVERKEKRDINDSLGLPPSLPN